MSTLIDPWDVYDLNDEELQLQYAALIERGDGQARELIEVVKRELTERKLCVINMISKHPEGTAASATTGAPAATATVPTTPPQDTAAPLPAFSATKQLTVASLRH